MTEAERQAFKHELPAGRFGRPEEIAATALLLAGPDGGFYVGATLSPNGGDVARTETKPRCGYGLPRYVAMVRSMGLEHNIGGRPCRRCRDLEDAGLRRFLVDRGRSRICLWSQQ